MDYSSALKMETVLLSETAVNLHLPLYPIGTGGYLSGGKATGA
jgi:hypothetical protein